MFRITGGKGFHITFPNGYKLSTQFGPGNYCDNYNMRIGEEDLEAGKLGSTEVEIAIINPAGELIELERGGTVDGYVDVEKWYEYLNLAKNKDN